MINKEAYTVEWCPFCEDEVVIYVQGLTECPECGEILFPCSACAKPNCADCPYQDEKEQQNISRITKEEVKEYLAFLGNEEDRLYGRK